jgi:electron transfer flavoprotein beta subunit
MKIVVCLKAVPGYVDTYRISESGDRIAYESPNIIFNESDEYALEEAMALKKPFGGEVIVMTVGPLTSQRVLFTGLAKNADRAIRVDADLGNAEMTSAALAGALKSVEFDLILTGVETSDNLAAEVGVRLAERLGIPGAYAVIEVAKGDISGSVKVTKEIGGGTMQVLEMPLPALLCIQSGIQPISYVPMRRVLQAQANQPVECFSPGKLALGERPGGELKIVDIFPAKDTHRAEMIAGTPSEIARKIFRIIRERTQ